MNISILNTRRPKGALSRSPLLGAIRPMAAAVPLGLLGVMARIDGVFAQSTGAAGATAPAGGLGAQINTMSGEAVNAGGTGFSAVCYLAAAICFGLGVWALWQSRQPQNRETGYVGRGVAGLVLCGLFATAGVWIGKAAVSASGGQATITGTPSMVTFGSGGGGGNTGG